MRYKKQMARLFNKFSSFSRLSLHTKLYVPCYVQLFFPQHVIAVNWLKVYFMLTLAENIKYLGVFVDIVPVLLLELFQKLLLLTPEQPADSSTCISPFSFSFLSLSWFSVPALNL